MTNVNLFIRQLTGIRFVAAAWVLLYHLQGPLANLGVLFAGFADVLRVGRLGVDLFFALSGFILTHTYLTKLGKSAHWRASLKFWWLRLARIYPVHLVMLVVAGVAVVAAAKFGGEALARDWLTPWDFVKNLLLIQEWGPNPQRGWNFVAWSLSMEWLAYLLFPILILIIWRCWKSIPTALLPVLWVLVLVPLLAYGSTTGDPYYTDNWGSTIRILTEFTAGAITYVFVRRFMNDVGDGSAKTERVATLLSFLMPILIIIGAIALANWPAAQPETSTLGEEALPPYFHLWLVPLLIVWIGALSLSRRGVATALSTKILVFGGFISYSLYMTHLVWFGLWRAGMRALGIDGGALYAIATIGLVLGALVIAWLMWKFVEEPAREWMRKRVGTRALPTEEAGEERSAPVLAEPVAIPEEPQAPRDPQAPQG